MSALWQKEAKGDNNVTCGVAIKQKYQVTYFHGLLGRTSLQVVNLLRIVHSYLSRHGDEEKREL